MRRSETSNVVCSAALQWNGWLRVCILHFTYCMDSKEMSFGLTWLKDAFEFLLWKNWNSGTENWSIRTFHSGGCHRLAEDAHYCCWIYDISKLIFHLLICSLSLVSWFCCCLAVYSRPLLRLSPLLLKEPQKSQLALPQIFSSFLPSQKHSLSLYSQCNDEKSIHSVYSEQWYLKLNMWNRIIEIRRICRVGQ